ncbi:MAG: 50S ribosomal protein L25 [Anaerolineae bacterium]|nr:50S ribosomal protein L25 [Anaerolineae bacterium]
MEALDLKAEARQVVKGHAKELRRQGLVPGVVYGRDLATEPIQIDARALELVIMVAGSHQLINLQIGKDKPRLTLAREIQRDSIRRHFLHIDFYAVKMDQKVHAEVPLVFVGASAAVQDLGGILTQGLDQLEVECLPSDLVASITVDINGLVDINDSISVTDLVVPDTITVLSDPDSMVAKVEAPRKVEELEALEEEEVEVGEAEPEVITEAREGEEERTD